MTYNVFSGTLNPTRLAPSPKIAPFAWGDLDSPESTSQTAFRSVQPFLQGRRTWTVESYSLGCANVHPSFFLMHTRIHNPNGFSIISAVVAELTTVTDRQTALFGRVGNNSKKYGDAA